MNTYLIGTIPGRMAELTSKLKEEIKDWKRSLGNMSDENILMKTRLSNMLQGNFDINLLPQVENLYSLLLTEEEFINLLRHNVVELDSLIKSENTRELNKNRFELMGLNLQSQMITAKIRLNKLKSEFNAFFQEGSKAPIQTE